MDRLPVIQKTKLTKEQTYFVHQEDLGKLLAHSPQVDNIELRFSDDPSQFKSNYDRFVKQEGKLVVLSVRYTPPPDDAEPGADTKNYLISVYAILRTIREDLIAEFETEHFHTMLTWINEKRDAAWRRAPHALQFLIDLETEKIETAYDIDFDSYGRHAHKQRFRSDGRKHGTSRT